MLKVGDRFDSFENFNQKLQQYKHEVFNDFWIRDCRKNEVQACKYPESSAAKASPELIYYYLRIACIKGGRKYTARNKVKNTLTFRQNCPATMYLKLTSCGKFLEIKELNENHSHTTTQSLFKCLPQQRLIHIPDDHKTNSTAALQAGANKTIMSETGCLVTLKDLTNLSRKPQTRMKFEECISTLRSTYNCDVQIFVDEDANLKCLYFQDEEMKHTFEAYPEIIFVDGSYCSDKSRAATYLILVEDAEGGAEIVACGILLNENEDTIDWFVKTFKEQNPKTSEIVVVMSDKDNKERNIFKCHFPNASLQICLFHTLQIFNREVSVKKMSLSSKECKVAKTYLQKLAYACSETAYDEIYMEMKRNVPEVVTDYYEKNWEPIKDEWVLYLTFRNLSFFNKMNRRLENVNAKLKSVISRFSNLEDFIKNFFNIVTSSRADRNMKYAKHYHKVTTKTWEVNSVEDSYSKLLTNFAFKKVQQQLKSTDTCKDFGLIEEDRYLAPTREGLLEVSPSSCQCMFWTSIKLPCRHIFNVRSMCNIDLFDENICLRRWQRSYFESVHPFFSSNPSDHFNSDDVNIEAANPVPKKQRPLTNHQKFKMMNDECLRLAQMSSEVSSERFYGRLRFIKKLVSQWENNLDQISGSDDENQSDNQNLSDTENHNDDQNENENQATEYKSEDRLFMDFSDTTPDTNESNFSNADDTSNGNSNSISNVSISDVEIPNVKTRERPKECGNTVIGLKRKRKK